MDETRYPLTSDLHETRHRAARFLRNRRAARLAAARHASLDSVLHAAASGPVR